MFFCKAELLWVSWEQCGKNNFSELEKLFFCRALFVANFLGYSSYCCCCCCWGPYFSESVQRLPSSVGSAVGFGVQVAGPIPGAALFAEVLRKQYSRSDCEQSKHARKKTSELEKSIFCKASVFFKLLRKTMFQVPRPIHIWILGGTEAVQTCAKKQFFGAWKIVFLQSPISSRKTIYKGPRQKNELQRGIANLAYKQ